MNKLRIGEDMVYIKLLPIISDYFKSVTAYVRLGHFPELLMNLVGHIEDIIVTVKNRRFEV